MTRNILILFLMASLLGLAGCSTSTVFSNNSSISPSAPHDIVNTQGFPNDPAFWQGNNTVIWDKLQHVPLTQLQSATSADPTIRGWIQLAVIGKQYSTDQNQLINQLMAWRAANPSHPGNSLFPDNGSLSHIQNTPPPRHITLLLPLHGPLSASGQTVRDGFLSTYYASSTKNQQTISFLDTSQNNIAALYQQALSEGADMVVGPLTKENVQSLSRANIPVRTLALNYTDGSLPTNFYEFGLSPVDEAEQLADKVWQANHKRAIIIAPQDAWGQRVVGTLTSRWQSLGGSVSDTFYFTKETDLSSGIAALLHVDRNNDQKQMKKENNKTILEQQRRQDFDVIFLLAPPQSAREIVPLLKYYYANNVPIYSTSVVFSGKSSPQDADLNGVMFSDTPWTLSGGAGSHPDRLYAVGRDAWLISNQISRLEQLPAFPIYGATGALTLTPQHKIYRRLAWTQIREGHP